MERNPGLDWRRGRGRDLRLRQPGGRGQPQRRAHGAAARGTARVGAGRHRQPPVRLGAGGRGAWRRARSVPARRSLVDRGRRREHVARALRDAQGRGRASAAARRSTTRRSAGASSTAHEGAYGVDSMPETAENVAEDFGVSRADQDAFALRSQQRAAAGARPRASSPTRSCRSRSRSGRARHGGGARRASAPGHDAGQAGGAASPVWRRQARSRPATPRASTTAPARSSSLRKRPRGGTGSRRERAWSAAATAGVRAADHGRGPAAGHAQGARARAARALRSIDVVELNEAFASQALAVLRELGLPDDAAQVNPNGGAIAIGHPLGMRGARLVIPRLCQLRGPARPLRALHHVHRRRAGDRGHPRAGVALRIQGSCSRSTLPPLSTIPTRLP